MKVRKVYVVGVFIAVWYIISMLTTGEYFPCVLGVSSLACLIVLWLSNRITLT